MPTARHRLATSIAYALAATGGLLVAAIIIANLHIIVGLEQGYAATPGDVLGFSLLLALADIVLLVSGPVIGVLALARLSGPGSSRGSPAPPGVRRCWSGLSRACRWHRGSPRRPWLRGR